MNFHFENELAGKIALVTGGSKGAGKAIADRLASAGAKGVGRLPYQDFKQNHFYSTSTF